jgi:antitoxin CptB
VHDTNGQARMGSCHLAARLENAHAISQTGRMSETLDERRRKLLFRAWRRGFREMDLIAGNFAEQNLGQFNEAELDEFERLLAVPDWDVYAWLIGDKPVPDNYQGPVLDRMIAFRYGG